MRPRTVSWKRGEDRRDTGGDRGARTETCVEVVGVVLETGDGDGAELKER